MSEMQIQKTAQSPKIPRKIQITSEDLSIKVKIDEKIFQLTRWHFKQMTYFKESIVLSFSKDDFGPSVIYEEKFIPIEHFTFMFDVIYMFLQDDYSEVPIPTKVKSNNPKDSIGEKMTNILDQYTGGKQDKNTLYKLDRLYHFAHFAGFKTLCSNISAYLAAKVYFLRGADLQQLKSKYRIKGDFTYSAMLKLREQYSFMGMVD